MNFEDIIIRVIFTLALAVFVVMAVAVFALFRWEGKAPVKRLSGSTFRDTLQSLIGILEKNPRDAQALNWVACLVIAAYVVWLNYSRVSNILDGAALYPYFIGLAIISPTCLAVAWLRLTGMKWRSALSFFVWMPVVFGGLLLVRQILSWLGILR